MKNRPLPPYFRKANLLLTAPKTIFVVVGPDAWRHASRKRGAKTPVRTLESRSSTMDRDARMEFARLFAEQVIDDFLDQLPFEDLTERKAADLDGGTAADIMSNTAGGRHECNTKTEIKSSRSG